MHRMVARSDPLIHANLDTNTIRAGLLYWVSKKKYMASYLFSKYDTFEGSEWNQIDYKHKRYHSEPSEVTTSTNQ